MKKIIIFLLTICCCLQFACVKATAESVEYYQTCISREVDGNILEDIGNLFTGANAASKIEEKVYLGGYPLGITIDGDGVTVIGLNEFIAEDGSLKCPAMDAGLEINDVIIELGGRSVYGSAKLAEIASKSNGNALSVRYMRDGELRESVITPQKDFTTKQYRLGLWSRDSSSGIGTLTYVRTNLNFGSLGHPITDSKGNIIQCKNGGVFRCSIDGVEKGRKGAAGELKGSFNFEKRVGNIYANNKFGAFGTFNTLPKYCKETIEVADIAEIKPGKAQIYCTLDGEERRCYEVEIVKAVLQTSREDRGMVIHITDPLLLEKTGGIVQGMSGSPIVQNGKLVGAVTHVFVNDPTRGYGMYAKWMLTN